MSVVIDPNVSGIVPTDSWTCYNRVATIAILVGCVAFAAGICGGLGLLQSYQKITLSFEICTIGHPGLWSMCIAGMLGIVSIAVGSCVIMNKSNGSASTNRLDKMEDKIQALGFGNYFDEIGLDNDVDREQINQLGENAFWLCCRMSDKTQCHVILRTSSTSLLVTKVLTSGTANKIAENLKELGFAAQVLPDVVVDIDQEIHDLGFGDHFTENEIAAGTMRLIDQLGENEFWIFYLNDASDKHYVALRTLQKSLLITKALPKDDAIKVRDDLEALGFVLNDLVDEVTDINQRLRQLGLGDGCFGNYFEEAELKLESDRDIQQLDNKAFFHFTWSKADEELDEYYVVLKTSQGTPLVTKVLKKCDVNKIERLLEELGFDKIELSSDQNSDISSGTDQDDD